MAEFTFNIGSHFRMIDDTVLRLVDTLVTVVVAVFASSGFWLYIQKRLDRKSMFTQLLLGLAQDRIVCLGMKYIDRGCLSREEYELLKSHLYTPYLAMGGNSMAGRVMAEVEKLPIQPVTMIFKEPSCNESNSTGERLSDR